MKKVVISAIIILIASTAAFTQTKNQWKAAGVTYTKAKPNWVPKRATESEFAIDSTTGYWWMYSYQANDWLNMGGRVQETGATGAPAYTPNKSQSLMAINTGDSLYHYRSGAWRLVSGGGGGSGHVIANNGTAVAQKDTLNLLDSGDIDYTLSNTSTATTVTGVVKANVIDSTNVAPGALSVTDLGQHSATSGQVLKWTGSQWAPANDIDTGDNWGSDVVNHDGTITGNGTSGSPLKVDTSVISTVNDVNVVIASLPQVYAVGLLSPLPDPGPEGSVALKVNDLNGTIYAYFSNGTTWLDGGLFLDTLAVGNIHIAPSAVDSTKIANGSISVLDIGQNSATTGQVLVWNGTQWAAQDQSLADNWGSQVVQRDSSLSGSGTTASPLGIKNYAAASNGQVPSKGTGTITWVTPLLSEVDGSTTNELQQIDTFAIVSNILRASLSSDGVPFKSVDLAPYLDDQTVVLTEGAGIDITGTYPNFTVASTITQADGTETVVTAGTGISVSGDGSSGDPYVVSSTVVNTDAQTLAIDSTDIGGVTERFEISISGGNSIFFDVPQPDGTGTDDQILSIDSASTTGGQNFLISIESGNSVSLFMPDINSAVNIYNSNGNIPEDRDVTMDGYLSFILNDGLHDMYHTLDSISINYGVETSDGQAFQNIVNHDSGSKSYEIAAINSYATVQSKISGNIQNGSATLTLRASSDPNISQIYLDTTGVQIFSKDNDGTAGQILRSDGTYVYWSDETTALNLYNSSGNILADTIRNVNLDSTSYLYINYPNGTYAVEFYAGEDSLATDGGVDFLSPDQQSGMTINDGGAYLSSNGNQVSATANGLRFLISADDGTPGQILRSDGTYLYWDDPVVNTDDQALTLDSSTTTGGQNFLLSIEDGNSVTLFIPTNTDAQTLSIDSVTITTGERYSISISDGNTIRLDDDDHQTIDTFSISSNILSMSIQRDGQAAKTVSLASYLDNTDSQTLSLDSTDLVGLERYHLSISGGNNLYWDDDDNQTVDTFSLSGTTLTLALEGDREAPYTVAFTNWDTDVTNDLSGSGASPRLAIWSGSQSLTSSSTLVYETNTMHMYPSADDTVFSIIRGSRMFAVNTFTDPFNGAVNAYGFGGLLGNTRIFMKGFGYYMDAPFYQSQTAGIGFYGTTGNLQLNTNGDQYTATLAGDNQTANRNLTFYFTSGGSSTGKGNPVIFQQIHSTNDTLCNSFEFLAHNTASGGITHPDSTLFRVGNYDRGTALNILQNRKVGVQTRTPTRDLDVNGEARIRDLTTTSPTLLMGVDATGVLSSVTLGTNLSFTGTTLNASGGGSDTNIYTTDGNVQDGGTVVDVSGDDPIIFNLDAAGSETNRMLRMVTDYSSDDAFTNFIQMVAPQDSLVLLSYDNGISMIYEGPDGAGTGFSVSSNTTITLSADSLITPSILDRSEVHSIVGMYGTTVAKISGYTDNQTLVWDNTCGCWSAGSAPANNIYTADGTITDYNRTVTLDSSTLKFDLNPRVYVNDTDWRLSGGLTVSDISAGYGVFSSNLQRIATSTDITGQVTVTPFGVTLTAQTGLDGPPRSYSVQIDTTGFYLDGPTGESLPLIFYETSGGNTTKIQAGNQSSSYTYILPVDDPNDGDVLTYNSGDQLSWEAPSTGGGAVADADYGDITVSGTGTVWTIDNSTVTSAKILDGTIANGDLASGVGGIYKGSGTISGTTVGTLAASGILYFAYSGGNNGIGLSDGTNTAFISGQSGNYAAYADNSNAGFTGPSSSSWLMGSTYALTGTASVAATNTATDRLVIQTNSTGTATTSFGTAMLFQGESSTTDNRDMARLAARWVTATDASRASKLAVDLGNSGGSLTEIAYFSAASNSAGELYVGSAAPAAYSRGGISPQTSFTIGGNTQTITVSSSSATANLGVALYATSNTTTSTGNITIGSAASFTQTSGTRDYVSYTSGFAPTSGTAVHNQFTFSGTFNQTGGANGITRGIYLNQTLTAVADMRLIEIAANNSNAKGIYQSGSSTTNNFVGGTTFGSTTAPNAAAAIDVISTTKGIKLPVMTNTQRDAISSPPEGLVVYSSDNDAVNLYDGSGIWKRISTKRTVLKTSDETVNNSSTFQADDALTFTAKANKKYVITYHLYLNDTDWTSGMKGRVVASGATTVRAAGQFFQDTDTDVQPYDQSGGTGYLFWAAATSHFSDLGSVTIQAYVNPGASDRTVNLEWAQDSAGVRNSVVKEGSWMEYEEIN